MKPVLGNAATSAPNDASFQRMRSFMLNFTVPATISNAHTSQVDPTAAGSSSCADRRAGAEAVQHAGQREEQHEGVQAADRLERQHAAPGGQVAASTSAKKGKVTCRMPSTAWYCPATRRGTGSPGCRRAAAIIRRSPAASPSPVPSPRMSAGLNLAQQEAVNYLHGPCLVLAGAGSGKTRVITHKIARLIQTGAGAKRIAAITFTNKAAAEMRERAKSLVGRDAKDVLICTFHALGVRMMRQDGSGAGPEAAVLHPRHRRRHQHPQGRRRHHRRRHGAPVAVGDQRCGRTRASTRRRRWRRPRTTTSA
jgi:hypothetical protein